MVNAAAKAEASRDTLASTPIDPKGQGPQVGQDSRGRSVVVALQQDQQRQIPQPLSPPQDQSSASTNTSSKPGLSERVSAANPVEGGKVKRAFFRNLGIFAVFLWAFLVVTVTVSILGLSTAIILGTMLPLLALAIIAIFPALCSLSDENMAKMTPKQRKDFEETLAAKMMTIVWLLGIPAIIFYIQEWFDPLNKMPDIQTKAN